MMFPGLTSPGAGTWGPRALGMFTGPSGLASAHLLPRPAGLFSLHSSCVSGWMGKLRLSCDLPEHQLHGELSA